MKQSVIPRLMRDLMVILLHYSREIAGQARNDRKDNEIAGQARNDRKDNEIAGQYFTDSFYE